MRKESRANAEPAGCTRDSGRSFVNRDDAPQVVGGSADGQVASRRTIGRDSIAERGFTVRALVEIAIRCIDLDAMVAFYRDVLGLEPFNDPENRRIVFFRIAEGFGGHTAVLVLFRHDLESAGRTRGDDMPPATGPGFSLHHIALSLLWEEQEAVIAWYENLGLGYTIETSDWVGWRVVFTFDPDGNTVELVAKNLG